MVHDCGTPVNPKLIEGQVRGGLVQGLGAVLGEELRYDPDTCQLMPELVWRELQKAQAARAER